MLIDEYMKEFHFNEVHKIAISGTPERIYPVLWAIDFAESRVIKLLFTVRGLRGLPMKALNLESFISHGFFVLLEEKKGEELILGLIGRSWRRDYDIQNVSSDEFVSFVGRGYIKAAWNFHLSTIENGRVVLSTETRVYCTDRSAKLKFSLYWLIISPFSRLIRRIMLRQIKREVEN